MLSWLNKFSYPSGITAYQFSNKLLSQFNKIEKSVSLDEEKYYTGFTNSQIKVIFQKKILNCRINLILK
jgi:hypothetical protein